MSCYRVLKSEGLIQPKRVGQDLRQAAEQRRQRLKAAEKYRIGGVTEYLSRLILSLRCWYRDDIGFDHGC